MIRALRFLHHLPIRRKLNLIAMLTTGLALTLACLVFAIYDRAMKRRELVGDLSTTAELIGFNTASALSFSDPGSAEETLRSVRAQPHVVAACVYDRDGAVFATYRRGDAPSVPIPARVTGVRDEFDDDALEVVRRIVVAGDEMGFIYLRSELTELRERLARLALIFVIVLVGVGLVAFGVVSRLQRVISGPVLRLAAVAEQVAREKNYSVRVSKHGRDEIGVLIDGFNTMLAQIQARDAALQTAHDELERRVEERTRELATSLSLLNATLDSTTDGILAIDLEGRAVCFNSRFLELWKVPADIAARQDVVEMARFAAARTHDPEGFMRLVLDSAAHPGAIRCDIIELVTGQTFERYVHPQRIEGRNVGVVISYRDITERREAQEQAAREKARFQFIFESVPVGICLDHRRADGTHDRVLNDAHLRIGGLDRAQATDEALARITHPVDLAQQQLLRRQLEQGVVSRFSLEQRYLRPDGQTVWVVHTVQRQRLADGTCQDLSTVVDITELKRTQEQVAAERARFKFIFEAVPVGISWFVPYAEHTHLVNPAHETITGVSAEESRIPGAFARVSHPDDYRRQQELTGPFVRGEIDHYSIEKRYLHPDGRVVWAVLTSRMFTDPATGTKQSVTTLVDVTALKQAQEAVLRQQARFKSIFEAVPVGFTWMVRGQLDTRIANPAYARITGVPIEQCRDLERCWEATHPDDRVRQRALHVALLAGDIDHYEAETRFVHADGSVQWGAIAVRLYRDDASGETQEISTVVDITERKHAEATLAAAHKQLLDISRLAGMAEVATGVLHNVGNVLNSVNVSATVLDETVRQSKIDRLAKLAEILSAQTDLARFFTADVRGQQVPTFVRSLATHLAREQAELLRELESLRKNVEHIKDIVAMQQSYAKVSGVAEAVEVSELIDDALQMSAGGFVRHDVAIVRDFEANPTVRIEKHKVLQILVNLLRNAKYACGETDRPDKRIVLHVTADDARVKIAVTDNGVGISPENLTRIFAHGFTTRKDGHGFGLHSGAITARELGGSLIARSDGPGLGATFVLELPLQREERAT